jgi:hypothetical protein
VFVCGQASWQLLAKIAVSKPAWRFGSVADMLLPSCLAPTLLLPGECDSSEKYPLWEVPLWAVEDANKASIASMDPEGNAYDNYKRELDWRMAGNRAPLGLFFHAGAPGRLPVAAGEGRHVQACGGTTGKGRFVATMVPLPSLLTCHFFEQAWSLR